MSRAPESFVRSTVRPLAAYGPPRVGSFSQITSDVALQGALQHLYGSVDNIDLWVGGLAEDHVAGTSVGPLFRTVLADQFTRLRDGDRFWYAANLTDRQVDVLNHTQLSDVIRRNTGLDNLQRNVFVFDVTFKGKFEQDLSKSPRGTFEASKSRVGFGDSVDFTVRLDPATLNYAVIGYNVGFVLAGLIWQASFSGAQDQNNGNDSNSWFHIYLSLVGMAERA